MRLDGSPLFELRGQSLRLLQQNFHLYQVHLCDRTNFKASLKNAQRFLAAGDGLTGQRDALVQFPQRKIADRNLANQADGESAACLIGSEIGFEGRILEVSHPAPEIEFPGGQPHIHLIQTADLRLPRACSQ
jgi:hypothetical protein